MLKLFRAKGSRLFFWPILALLVIGLAGFGISTGGIGGQHVARVGDQEIGQDAYLRALDQEMRAISQQIGRPLEPGEAREFGLDRMVLAQLVADAALDEEAQALGISTADAIVREQLLATPAFHGPDGAFDRETYRFALNRTGLEPREYEELIRREAARALVAQSVQAPARLPDTAADTIAGFLGEKRSFDWLRLEPAMLGEDRPVPREDDLRAFHDADPERYTRPETRRIAYASLTPDMVAASAEISEDAIRAAYEAGSDRFHTPERRVADRIVFGSAAEAQAARERLDAGEIDFDGLAAERGLRPGDIDQGFVTALGLDAELREALFGTDAPGLVGPVATPLGPALYRINAILAETTLPLDDVREDLRRELALEEADARIAAETQTVADLVAGGATIEEIAAETALEPGTLELSDETTGGLAGDPAFREAAMAAEPGFETDVIALENGGIASLRIDEIVPPAAIPFDEARDQVERDWIAATTRERLLGLAEDLRDELADGLAMADLAERLDAPVQSAGPLARGEAVPGAPDALVEEIFAAAPDAAVAVPGEEAAILARLTAIEPFDPEEGENGAVLENLRAELRRGAAQDMLNSYVAALQARSEISVNQTVLAATLDALP